MDAINQILAAEWSYHPYRPILSDRGEIFVTRIVPDRHELRISWIGEAGGSVDVYWRRRDEGEYRLETGLAAGEAVLSGLEENCDYQFYLQDRDGRRSLVRLARTGDYIKTPIQYLHKDDTAYALSGRCLGSPSIVRQPDGSLLASMDVFVMDGPQNLTTIYRSDDNGATWHWQCELCPCFWGKLFVFRGEVYLLACSTEHGDILLGKALDGGRRFTAPAVLLRGPGRGASMGTDMSPEPPAEYGGRLWFNFHWGSWSHGMHYPCIASAPADSDILDPANWTVTPPCIYDENWPGTAEGKSNGSLEGTFAVLPDGGLYMMARYEIKACEPDYGLALLYKVRTDDPKAPLEYVRTVPFEGNHSKFTVHRDEETGDYYSIISRIRGSAHVNDRNLLSLVKSRDCIHWSTVMDVMDLTDQDPAKAGVQYVDFFLEEDRIYYAVRAGINGADSYHNSNVILFGTIEDYRR